MNALAGTGALIRLALRRDRVRLTVWVLLLGVMPMLSAASFAELFPTEAARAGYAAGVTANPAVLAMQGPVYGTSLGALTVARMTGFCALLIAVMSILTVVRHTRAEEEAGRRELLGATVVGRHAPLTAAMATVAIANVALGAVSTAGLLAAGLPVAGSAAFGVALAATGLVFAAVAAFTAQLTESSRVASGSALAVLGLAFLVRATGDATPDLGQASWASPLAWAARVRPFTGERWWVLALAATVTTAVAVVAYVASARRDLAAGVLPPRPGRAAASPSLRSPLALAARQQRGLLVAWTAGFAVVGAAFGGIAKGAEQLLASSPELIDLLEQFAGGRSIVDLFFATEFGVIGLIAAAYSVQAALRLRVEETAQRAEPVLATAVGRTRWATGQLVFALLGPAVALAAAGTAAGLVHGLRVGDVGGQLPRILGAALVQLPAVWVFAGVAALLFGIAPRLVALTWGVLAGSLVFGQLGELLQLPRSVLDLSPFTHVPRLPGGDVSLTPLVWLTATAIALLAVGLAGFRRRDLAT